MRGDLIILRIPRILKYKNCSYILLLFLSISNDSFHADIGKNFVICTKSCRFMQCICQVGPGIGRQIPEFLSGMVHCHFTKRSYDSFTGIFFIQLLLQDPKDKQCKETSEEMCLYPVFTPQVYGSCLKLVLHDPKTFFNFPAFLLMRRIWSIPTSSRFVHTA